MSNSVRWRPDHAAAHSDVQQHVVEKPLSTLLTANDGRIFARSLPRDPCSWHTANRSRNLSQLAKRRKAVKLSARNQLKGKVVEVRRGVTTAHVRIRLGGDTIITASITNEAVEELDLKVGDSNTAINKASDVMVAK
jgi:molybdopterin-binding protein